jgi:LmbE family N-acetylglucosaminyl deacetylase
MNLIMLALLASTAPQPRHSAAETFRDLKKLTVVGSALFVAAHPDDENTRLLATLANEVKVRTAYLSMTRGEGGQNLIGQELGPLLGVIRTQELLAARRVDGAEQFFTRARDFGFSKSVDETLATWDHDGVVADTVSVIRALRPDVIITRFALEGGDTHGHHTASARVALEAFKAAADPAYHPELGAPWQAKRILHNIWEGKAPPLIDSSPYSPLLGVTYGELAADSRSMHKSQGFGAAPLHGSNPESFNLLGGEPAVKSLFDGVDLTWKRVPGSAEVSKLLDQAVREYKLDNPSASVPVLLKARDALKKLPDQAWKLAQLEGVIADCMGLYAEATASKFSVNPGDTLELTLLSRGPKRTVTLSDGQKIDGDKATLKVPADARLSTPEWLERPTTAPEPAAQLWADFDFGNGVTLRRPVVFKWTDPTVGERMRPIEILPSKLLKPSASLLLFTDDKPKQLDGRTVPAPKAASEVLDLDGQVLTRIDYPHIPIQTVLTKAQVKLVRLKLDRGRVHKIGYVMGAGDDVPQALKQVGYEVTLLDEEALTSKPLKGYDAIVIGIRAYNVNPKLPAHKEKLMQFVKDGGTLLLQYNTKNRVSEVPPDLGPYPFEISHDRVTDETAEVTLDAHAVATSPNKLGREDFEGWVQERGLYFADKWDPKYETPLSMHDPNEPAKKGNTLVATVGKGRFVYTGLAFFRQLPAGVPGAYRLFANLLAHP